MKLATMAAAMLIVATPGRNKNEDCWVSGVMRKVLEAARKSAATGWVEDR